MGFFIGKLEFQGGLVIFGFIEFLKGILLVLLKRILKGLVRFSLLLFILNWVVLKECVLIYFVLNDLLFFRFGLARHLKFESRLFFFLRSYFRRDPEV